MSSPLSRHVFSPRTISRRRVSRPFTAVGIAVIANACLAAALGLLGSTSTPQARPRAKLSVLTVSPSPTTPAPVREVPTDPSPVLPFPSRPPEFALESIAARISPIDIHLPDHEIAVLALRSIPFPRQTPVEADERRDNAVSSGRDSTPDDIRSADGVDTPPRPISTPAPVYPRREHARGTEGVVAIRFLIDTGGRVRRIEVLRNEGPDAFVRTVEQAVKEWRFESALDRGQTVEVWARKTFRFRAKDRP